MEIQAKAMELEYVLNETKEKLNFIEQQKCQLESQLADTREKLNQEQNLVSAFEEQKNQLSSALDEVSSVSVNSRSDHVNETRCSRSVCTKFVFMLWLLLQTRSVAKNSDH
jgi:predicted  nucleic acid-binding Zn-ribbon protein